MGGKIDILDRQPFVDRLIEIVRLIADNGRGCTFTIDGRWGCGKSFVLDMFEKQNEIISDEDTAISRYAIFRYNCWEYDYYEEPLVAIVATLINDIDAKINLLSQKTSFLARACGNRTHPGRS